MLLGKDYWWCSENGNLVFYDGPNDPQSRHEGPSLHHFRGSSLKDEKKYLTNTWNVLLEQFQSGKLQLPLSKFKLYDDDGKVKNISWCEKKSAEGKLYSNICFIEVHVSK